MIGYVVTATGWTWDYAVENLDLPRLRALNKAWRVCPPVHATAHLIAVALGARKPAAERPASQRQDMSELFDQFPVREERGLDTAGMSAADLLRTAEDLMCGPVTRRPKGSR